MDPLIFLSYAREDALAVHGVYLALRKRGLRPWMDTPPTPFESEGILAGLPWQDVVRKTLQSAHLVLAFFSARSVAKRGFVQREYRMALDLVAERPVGSVFLVPVLLEPCEVPDLVVGTTSLRNLQFFSMFDLGLDALVDLLSALTPADASAFEMAALSKQLSEQLSKAVAAARNRLSNIKNRKSLKALDPDRHAIELRNAEAEISTLARWLRELELGKETAASFDKRVRELAQQFHQNYESEARRINEAVEHERLCLIGKYSRKLAAKNREAEERRKELEDEIVARADRKIRKPDLIHYDWFKDVPPALKTRTQWKQLGRTVRQGAKPSGTVYCRPLRKDVDLFERDATEAAGNRGPA